MTSQRTSPALGGEVDAGVAAPEPQIGPDPAPAPPTARRGPSRSSSFSTSISSATSESTAGSDTPSSAARAPSSTTSESHMLSELEQAAGLKIAAANTKRSQDKLPRRGSSSLYQLQMPPRGLTAPLLENILRYYTPDLERSSAPVSLTGLDDPSARTWAINLSAALIWRHKVCQIGGLHPIFQPIGTSCFSCLSERIF